MTEIPVLPITTRLLVMCSSRGRPQKLNEMIDSVYLNRSEGTELVVYVSEQDRELAEYRPVLERVPHIIGPHRNMVQILNYLSIEVYPNMSYYTDLNDDQYVMTPHWDSIMIKAIEEHGGWSMASVESPNHLPYATGISAANALVTRVLEGGERERHQYLSFLQGGCSMFPIDLLRAAGVDMCTTAPVESALRRFALFVDEFRSALIALKHIEC